MFIKSSQRDKNVKYIIKYIKCDNYNLTLSKYYYYYN